MRLPTVLRVALLTSLAVFCLAAKAQADVVRFTSGQSIRVERAWVDGDVVVLRMLSGQEIRTLKDVVQEILPDRAAGAQTSADRPRASGGLRGVVDRVAARLGFDTRLAHALVQLESNYNPLAVSPRGAMGLMQITWAVAETYSVLDPFDPEQNLEAGLRHLMRLLQRFDMTHALAAYNAGEGAVRRYDGVPPYPETQNYVRRILAAVR